MSPAATSPLYQAWQAVGWDTAKRDGWDVSGLPSDEDQSSKPSPSSGWATSRITETRRAHLIRRAAGQNIEMTATAIKTGSPRPFIWRRHTWLQRLSEGPRHDLYRLASEILDLCHLAGGKPALSLSKLRKPARRRKMLLIRHGRDGNCRNWPTPRSNNLFVWAYGVGQSVETGCGQPSAWWPEEVWQATQVRTKTTP